MSSDPSLSTLAKTHPAMRRTTFIVLAAVVVTLVGYLLWIPTPALCQQSILAAMEEQIAAGRGEKLIVHDYIFRGRPLIVGLIDINQGSYSLPIVSCIPLWRFRIHVDYSP